MQNFLARSIVRQPPVLHAPHRLLMVIHILTHTGNLLSVEVMSEETIISVKEKIEGAIQLPVAQQRLIFNGASLPSTISLANCGIKHEDTLRLEPALAGG